MCIYNRAEASLFHTQVCLQAFVLCHRQSTIVCYPYDQVTCVYLVRPSTLSGAIFCVQLVWEDYLIGSVNNNPEECLRVKLSQRFGTTDLAIFNVKYCDRYKTFIR